MPAGYATVTVIAGQRQVDVALPEHAPVHDLILQLLELCEVPADPARPTNWRLSPVGNGPLAPSASLTSAGVVDGQILMLTPTEAAPPPAFVEELLDQVATASDRLSGRWGRPATTIALSAVTLACSGLALVLPWATGPERRMLGALAAGLALVLLGAAVWASRRDRRPAVLLLAASALWAAGAAGAWTAPPATVTTGLAAAVATTIVGARLGQGLGGVMALAVSAGVPAVLSGMALLAGATVSQVAMVGGLVATLATAALAQLLLATSGLTGGPSPTALFDRVRSANALLGYVLAGLSAYLMIAGTTAAGAWFAVPTAQVAFAALLGLLMLLRSRAFSRVVHRVPLQVAGVATLLAAILVGAVAFGGTAPLGAVAALALLATGGALVGLAASSRLLLARMRLALDVVEFLAIVAIIPTLMATLGWFSWLNATL
jgi:type VII secretion integral membrane protein EccD